MKIYLLSHGKLASGMKNTIELLAGDQPNLVAFDSYLPNGPDLTVFLQKLAQEKEQFIVVTDLLGGSVNRLALEKLVSNNIYLISGMNTALVLSLVLLDAKCTVDQIQKIVDTSKDTVRLLLPSQNSATNETEEDF
ncbi:MULTISPECIES: PTS sugar transporter subunit IIA [Lactobacillus]|uniref:PTS sugar transporter subunit IIA n=1 Tax=Lactobacillus TaxID=1578 RepID=UPI000EFB7B05|nr:MULTISPECIES: PTS fructose IIA subunit [Lactobacillus]MBH9988909.1 PTS fructose IIA subunit [Lactobacillus sp. M0392]MBI0023472.1 PTS fructose IIA subunit [Lactobacillus sp. W8171]MBI0043877.1 PTS fructose IIA subunit [Lactobacillus sp. M0393]MBC6349459.1 PTS fructose IIA subunit [Lactobacillus melliventris]RMC62067.1 PTS fructose IIA subunit [Lactobacillus sp. ESL0259]